MGRWAQAQRTGRAIAPGDGLTVAGVTLFDNDGELILSWQSAQAPDTWVCTLFRTAPGDRTQVEEITVAGGLAECSFAEVPYVGTVHEATLAPVINNRPVSLYTSNQVNGSV